MRFLRYKEKHGKYPKTVKINSCGRMRWMLELLEKNKKMTASQLSYSSFTSWDLQQALVLGLIYRPYDGVKDNRGKKTYHRVTRQGRKVMGLLREYCDPCVVRLYWWKEKKNFERAIGKIVCPADQGWKPYGIDAGYKLVDVPVKISDEWVKYFEGRQW